ncbi:MAG: phenylacetate-CoA ligase [Aureispira sp.]|jgi:phenylacetate-CoA ligase
MIDKRLKKYFSVVKNSSLFKEFYKNIDTQNDAPVMEKHILRKILKTQFDIQTESKGVYLVRSGGSSAKPLIFPVDIQENLHQRKLLAIELLKARIFSPKSIVLNVFSYQEMYRSAAILDDILERCDATTIPVSSQASYEAMYHLGRNFGVNTIIGTPSMLALLAKYVLDNSLSLKIDNLLFAGEYLLDSQIKLFQKVFETKQIYSLYGSAETGIWGWSNHSDNLTVYKTLDDVIIEVEQPDEKGNGLIVVTNLIRKRFPLFRYAMGDIGKLEYRDNKQVLTLKSREAKSFSIQASSYFLNDFDWLLESVSRFQIQLSSCSPVQIEILFLLVKDSFNKKNTDKILPKMTEKLTSIFGVNALKIKLTLKFVSEFDLYSNKTTSKTPNIVDFRH